MQVGDIVKSAIGLRKYQSQAREIRYGQVLQGVGNNKYLVSFEDGSKQELSSIRQLIVVKDEDELARYRKLLDELLNGGNDTSLSESPLPPECKNFCEDMPLYQTVGHHLSDMVSMTTASLDCFADSLYEAATLSYNDEESANTKIDTVANGANGTVKTTNSSTNAKNSQATAKSTKPKSESVASKKGKSKASSTSSKQKKASTSSKNNEGRKIEDEYDKKMREVSERINKLIEDGATYTISSSTDKMTWTVIKEHTIFNGQNVPIRLAQDLGIKDTEVQEILKESVLPLVDLFLLLLYKDGEWEKALETMNKNICLYNELKFQKKQDAHCRIATFSKSEFMTAHAFLGETMEDKSRQC